VTTKNGKKPTERRILVTQFTGVDEMLGQLRQEAKLSFHWFPAPSGQVEIHTEQVTDYDQLCDLLSTRKAPFTTRRAYRGPRSDRFA
jgi:hypothetical protein